MQLTQKAKRTYGAAMVESVKKVVWVLGAGFSQPLGAPLLVGFFSEESLTEVRGLYPQPVCLRLHELPVDWAYHLYWWGRGEQRSPTVPAPRNLWHDAEQFLSYLDGAALAGGDKHRWKYLSNIVEAIADRAIDLDVIRAAARRLLAAECMGFLQEADLEAEHWQPFMRWGEELVAGEDTILCFNYDLAPERIRTHSLQVRGKGVAYETVLPVPRGHFEPKPGIARVLKPHGSVDWTQQEDARVALLDDARKSLCAKDNSLVLGTPGPSKLKITRSLETLWELGEQALREADAVVFVGYRFPPSDTEACRRLMGALGANRNHYVAAHIVLGPEVGKPEVKRLQEMLKVTFDAAGRAKRTSNSAPHRPCYNVLPQPMYSQDFFLLFTRELITTPRVL